MLLSSFAVPTAVKNKPVTKATTEVAALLKKWYAEGTAAGHYGDFYDNHDRKHSRIGKGKYPQLTRIEYSAPAKAENLDWGCQVNMLFSGVVIGNSSTSLTHKTRLAMSDPINAVPAGYGFTTLQPIREHNHLYFYPEHRDYDPGRNGKPGGGYGDVFFANTPYTITSKGSSGSDAPFMHAVINTLAAFHPDVKQKLVKSRLLIPAVQMIFRRCNKNVASDEKYLTGIAHPPVFEKQHIDTLAMIRMAHSMKPDHLPPMARFRVIRESASKGTKMPELVFNTASAVSRVHRTPEYSRVMQIDATPSIDANEEALTYHWKVLTGDSERIKIKRLDDTGAKVELTIPWHGRFAISPGSPMKTNRVDIACFVSNGHWFSAPAIVSTYFPDNEVRVYSQDGKLTSRKFNKNYVDPLICPPGK